MKIKYRLFNNWGKICGGYVYKEFYIIIVFIDICICILKKVIKIKIKVLLEILDSNNINIKFRVFYKYFFYVVFESMCYY